MALITKIREKSGIAAGAIAVSLVLFLVGSDIFQGRSRFFGGSSDEVGEIAGESIKYQDFQSQPLFPTTFVVNRTTCSRL